MICGPKIRTYFLVPGAVVSAIAQTAIAIIPLTRGYYIIATMQTVSVRKRGNGVGGAMLNQYRMNTNCADTEVRNRVPAMQRAPDGS